MGKGFHTKTYLFLTTVAESHQVANLLPKWHGRVKQDLPLAGCSVIPLKDAGTNTYYRRDYNYNLKERILGRKSCHERRTRKESPWER